MVQRGEDPGFAFEARQAIGIVRERLRQNLERHVSVELGISRSIHLIHAVFADLGGDRVGAESGADIEGHGARFCNVEVLTRLATGR